MSTGLSSFGGTTGLAGNPFGAAAGLAGNPFGGETPFGFTIPQGDPGAIEGASRAAQTLGRAFSEHARVLKAAAGIALEADGGWRGQAAGEYSQYSGHVQGVLAANAGACQQAAGALSTLSQALTHAQSVTKQALSDCLRYQNEATTQQGIAAQAGTEASTASAQAAAAVHPAAQVQLAHQATEAAGRQTTAAGAARAAEGQLKDAQTRGQRADVGYQETARIVTGQLESAAGELRQAPVVAGGPAVPITVSAGDVSLANAMLMGAGSLTALAGAVSSPAQLEDLACNLPITPAVALEFLQGYRDRVQMAKIAAEDKPLDGSIGGVIPGAPGQVLQGAWDSTKGTAELVWSGLTHPAKVPGAVASYVTWAVNNPVAFAKGAIDYQDWTEGHGWKALGEFVPAIVVAKGAGLDDAATGAGSKAVKFWQKNPEVRGDLTKLGGKGLGALGVPHASDIADAAAPYVRYSPSQLIAAVRSAPGQLVHGASQAEIRLLDSLASAVAGKYPLSAQLQDAMAKLPQDPQIVVVRTATPKVTYRLAPPVIIRRFPRAR